MSLLRFKATDGDGYELQMGRWSRRLAGPFLDFVGAVDGEAILDTGFADALSRRCPASHLNAVDLSPAYIDYARRNKANPKLAFDVGDACALPFPDQSLTRCCPC